LGFAVFVVAGSVTIGAGPDQGASTRVLAEWRRFLAELPVVSQPALLRAVVVAALLVVVAGSALGLWLALTAGEARENGSRSEPDAA
jgi:hypothetical protein